VSSASSLPQTIPQQSLPLVYQDGNGDWVMNQTWYLFFYNIAQQVLPMVDGAPLITTLNLATLTALLATIPTTNPGAPAGQLWWNTKVLNES
jgi:hypothetical protein